MNKEDVIYKLVNENLEGECLIVGKATTMQLIKDSLTKQKGVLQNYIAPDYGHNISVYEAITLIFAAIQAFNGILDIIKRLRSNGVDKEKLLESTKQSLCELNKVPPEKTEYLCTIIIDWCDDKQD